MVRVGQLQQLYSEVNFLLVYLYHPRESKANCRLERAVINKPPCEIIINNPFYAVYVNVHFLNCKNNWKEIYQPLWYDCIVFFYNLYNIH